MVIGFSGKLASGKSTGAIMLETALLNYGIPAETRSFARPLKEVCKIAGDTAIPMEHRIHRVECFFRAHTVAHDTAIQNAAMNIVRCGDLYPNQYGVKNRKLLQLAGTEYGRNILGDNIWIEIALSDYDGETIYIFDDVRFDNEALVLNTHILINEELNLELYRTRLASFAPDYVFSNHPSELGTRVTPHYVIPVGFSEHHIDVIAEDVSDEFKSVYRRDS